MLASNLPVQPPANLAPAMRLASRRLWIVTLGLVLVALLLGASALFRNREFYNDDALISLCYAQNLLRGNGLVWNPGERVEGYTNFLFVVDVSALGALGVDLEEASRLVNLAAFVTLTLFVGAVCYRDCRRRGLDPRVAVLPATLMLSSFELIVNALGGLEGPFLALLLTVALHLCGRGLETREVRPFGWSALLFGLACMTRPDTALFAGIALGMITVRTWTRKLDRRAPVLFGTVLGGMYLPYFLIRWRYYGAAFPNTFYVKAEGLTPERWLVGLDYIKSSLCEPPYLLPLALVAVVALILSCQASVRTRLFAACIVAGLIYIASVGGDHMPAFRLVVPLLPMAVFLLFEAVAGPLRHLGGVARTAGIAGLVGVSLLQLVRPALNPIVEDPAAFVGQIVGRWIRVAWPTNSLIALNTAGSTPYYAPDDRYIDMLGLNDTHIARVHIDRLLLPWQHVPGHTKGDGGYVLDRKPDYIIIGPAQGTDAHRPWFLSDLEIAMDPRLKRDYVIRRVALPTAAFAGYRRHFETNTGELDFTYYERINRARADSGSDPHR